ncbi:uncharacterized protein LOC131934823 [Physella acuta]|uniref:uncharacterized protein LOC131934823 n=1 Tax=Physella acuta TaxID=109671 RepID=UPI0027DC2B93|nr:uncharacterized protein LOC131934823 [Physella acuta]
MKHSVFYVWLHSCIVLLCQARTFYVKEGDPFLCEMDLNKVFFSSIRWNLITLNGTTINIADCDKSYTCQVNYDRSNFQALLRVKDYNSYYRSADMSITLNIERLTKDMQHVTCLYGFDQQSFFESVVCSFSFGVEPSDPSFLLKFIIPLGVGLPILAIIIACACRKHIRLKRTRSERSNSHTLNNRDSIFTVPVPSHQTENHVMTNSNTVHIPSFRPITSNTPARHTKSSRNKSVRPANTSSNLNKRGQVINNSNTASVPGSIPSVSNTSYHHTPSCLDSSVRPVHQTSNLNQRDTRASMTVRDYHAPSHLHASFCPDHNTSNLNQRDTRTSMTVRDYHAPSHLHASFCPDHNTSNLNQRDTRTSMTVRDYHAPSHLHASFCPDHNTSNLNQRDTRTSMTVPHYDPPSYTSLYPGRQTTSQYHVQPYLTTTQTNAALHVCPTCQSTVPTY